MGLDQFFTKKSLAVGCYQFLEGTLSRISGGGKGEFFFVEPSAGDGSFLDILPSGRAVGVDIAPRKNGIVGADFLKWGYEDYLPSQKKDTVVIGNPPFGHRSEMAVSFFNRATEMADTVAFILPVSFRKYFVHKQLSTEFQWVASFDLPRDAFYTDRGSYSVNTEFQVWTRLVHGMKNLREYYPPPIKHGDFEMYQYNNTQDAIKVFNNPFDFAVPCQGWQDYSRREDRVEKCEKNKQWILFKTKFKQARELLHDGIDYERLALKSSTSVPGFRKNDVVREYIRAIG